MAKYLHSMVRVRDIDESKKFYSDLLGLEEIRRVDNEAGKFTLVFLAPPDQHDAPIELTYNWGSDPIYSNTITVGMWNTDPQDNWHATSPHLMPEIDIYADGVKNTFDWSLGTSYATPAVAAEVVNFLSYVTGDAEFTSIDEYYDKQMVINICITPLTDNKNDIFRIIEF